jgi:hypothetical protein
MAARRKAPALPPVRESAIQSAAVDLLVMHGFVCVEHAQGARSVERAGRAFPVALGAKTYGAGLSARTSAATRTSRSSSATAAWSGSNRNRRLARSAPRSANGTRSRRRSGSRSTPTAVRSMRCRSVRQHGRELARRRPREHDTSGPSGSCTPDCETESNDRERDRARDESESPERAELPRRASRSVDRSVCTSFPVTKSEQIASQARCAGSEASDSGARSSKGGGKPDERSDQRARGRVRRADE